MVLNEPVCAHAGEAIMATLITNNAMAGRFIIGFFSRSVCWKWRVYGRKKGQTLFKGLTHWKN
jgi:hypothetical protein